MSQPLFFVFDGVDGAGKTTQIARFQGYLESAGHRITLCRDPGTSGLGEQIRELLLMSTDLAIDNRSEMLLYMAARAQLVSEVIQPALAAGRTVISDRFLLANVVYQGHAGGLDPEIVWRVGETATVGLRPQLTFVLDLDPVEASERRERVGVPDRLERRGLDYFQRVRAGFLEQARQHPETIAIIDAAGDPDTVAARVRSAAESVLSTV